MSRSSRGTDPAGAVSAAKRATALAGHPDVSWSIVLGARVDGPPPLQTDVSDRLAAALTGRPLLGPVPAVRSVGPDGVAALRKSFANDPYQDGGPALRVALAGPPSEVVVAAHHGALDGLGLLALLGVVLGSSVSSSARGLGPTGPTRSFALTAARRVAEALLRPPGRIAPARAPASTAPPGDVLVALDVPAAVGGTAALVAAAVRAVSAWNGRTGEPAGRMIVAIGASRRPGSDLTMEERSAYLRIGPVPPTAGEAAVRSLVRSAVPEPAAPPVRGLGPLVPAVRALSRRLGSTLLVSNLGTVTAPGLASVAFHPVAHGRSGVALGAATVGGATTLTLRARAEAFDEDGAMGLLAGVAAELAGAQR